MIGPAVSSDPDLGIGYTADRGPYIQMQSGKRYHPLDPRADEIEIEDIATGLSRMARYSGQTGPQILNVADHSTNVARVVRDHLGGDWAAEMPGLLHDAPEYVLGDKVRPVKAAFETLAPGILNEIEQRQWRAIVSFVRSLGFDFPEAIPDIVWQADNLVLQGEINFLIAMGVPWAPLGPPGCEVFTGSPRPRYWSKAYFLTYWTELLAREDAPRLEGGGHG